MDVLKFPNGIKDSLREYVMKMDNFSWIERDSS
jgi:hypothetical protein